MAAILKGAYNLFFFWRKKIKTEILLYILIRVSVNRGIRRGVDEEMKKGDWKN